MAREVGKTDTRWKVGLRGRRSEQQTKRSMKILYKKSPAAKNQQRGNGADGRRE